MRCKAIVNPGLAKKLPTISLMTLKATFFDTTHFSDKIRIVLRLVSKEVRKIAILCPRCGHQYDVTLFEFGSIVKCDCGARIKLDPGKGIILEESLPKRVEKKGECHRRRYFHPLTDKLLESVQ